MSRFKGEPFSGAPLLYNKVISINGLLFVDGLRKIGFVKVLKF